MEVAAAKATRRPPVTDLLRLLFAEAERRIRQTKRPDFYKPPYANPTVRRMHMEWRRADKARDRLAKQLKRRGFSVDERHLGVDWDTRKRREANWDVQQTKRQVALKELRLQVGMDLLGMPTLRAKEYLKVLQRKLAAL